MRILGIDPGENVSGAVMLLFGPSARGGAEVEWAHKAWPNDQMLNFLRTTRDDGYQVIVESMTPCGLSFGWSTLRTSVLIGRILEATGGDQITRKDVLDTLFGKKVSSADSAVRQLLLEEIGPVGRRAEPGPTYGVSGHAWQALGAVWAWLKREGGR